MIVLWLVMLSLIFLGVRVTSAGNLCDDNKANFNSCSHRKLRILVVDYGYVDSMTGAANRHLSLLHTLGTLGHDLYRAALRVGPTKNLPHETSAIFSRFQIQQHSKRLMDYKSGSVEEYVSLVRSWIPDVVILTLWFCGPTLNVTVPGYLLRAHRSQQLPGRVIIESSDVHALREEYFNNDANGILNAPLMASRYLSVMQQEEAKMYMLSDAIFSISDRDKRNMVNLVEKVVSRSDAIDVEAKIFVWRYVGTPWHQRRHRVQISDTNFTNRSGLIFVGPGNVPTNVLAIEFFLKEILDPLKKYLPNVIIKIVGSHWVMKRGGKRHPPFIREALACSTAKGNSTSCERYCNLRWVGKLSSDLLDNSLFSSRVFVSPILFSTGVNTKNLLPLETGLPLITTEAGAGGLCHESSCEIYRPFFVAKNASDFAKLTAKIYDDQELWINYSRSGYEYVQNVLSVKEAATDLERSFKELRLYN